MDSVSAVVSTPVLSKHITDTFLLTQKRCPEEFKQFMDLLDQKYTTEGGALVQNALKHSTRALKEYGFSEEFANSLLHEARRKTGKSLKKSAKHFHEEGNPLVSNTSIINSKSGGAHVPSKVVRLKVILPDGKIHFYDGYLSTKRTPQCTFKVTEVLSF